MPGVFDLLKQSAMLYKKHFKLMAGYAAFLLLPFIGIIVLNLLPLADPAIAIGNILLFFIQIFLWIWIGIVLIKIANEITAGKTPKPESIQKEVLPIMWPLVLTAVLQGIIVLGGFILLLVPGFIFMIWFAFAQVAVVLDKKQPIEALSASRSMVRGRFWPAAWRVLGGPVLFVLVYSIAFAVLAPIVAVIIPSDGLSSLKELAMTERIPIWLESLETLGDTFIIMPIMVIYSVLIYKAFKKGGKKLS